MKGLPRSLKHARDVRGLVPTRQKFTFSALAITIDGATGVGDGQVVLGDFPEGNLLIQGATMYIQFDTAESSGIVDQWDGDIGVGTTADANDALTASDVNIIPSNAIAAGAGVKTVARTRVTGSTAVVVDNTDNSLEVNLNVLVDDADISADGLAFTVTGEIDILYIVLGDD